MSAGSNGIQPVSLLRNAVLLCMVLSLTACLPKEMFRVSSEQAHSEAMQASGDIDARLSIDRELQEASQSPSSLVGSDNVSVSEHSDYGAAFGESLELSVEEFHYLPAGLMMLEGPESLSLPPQYSASSTSRYSKHRPAVGSAEERALAAINTKQALCRPGDKICMTSPYGVRRGKRIHKGIDIRAPLGSPIMAFRSGVVKIAQKTKVPIVVCTVQNTPMVKKNMGKLKPTNIHLHIVGVIQPEAYENLTTVDIADRVHGMMAEDLGPDLVLKETP